MKKLILRWLRNVWKKSQVEKIAKKGVLKNWICICKGKKKPRKPFCGDFLPFLSREGDLNIRSGIKKFVFHATLLLVDR
jgi:hypothetical protein